MISRPKYKIARRLGPSVFDKTQSPKFTLSESRRGKPKDPKHSRTRTEYGMKLIEKQRARFTYGVNERQFSRYVREATEAKEMKPSEALYAKLESRLDNVIYRMGFAPTRQAARQAVSHGHIRVNDIRINVASHQLSIGDRISIRPGSAKGPLFAKLDESLKGRSIPSWIRMDFSKKEAEIQGAPKLERSELPFSLVSILEFYSR